MAVPGGPQRPRQDPRHRGGLHHRAAPPAPPRTHPDTGEDKLELQTKVREYLTITEKLPTSAFTFNQLEKLEAVKAA